MLSRTSLITPAPQRYFHPTVTVMPMEFDREKYIELLMYILVRCYAKPNLGKTVLSTIMYFIDFNYFEIYGNLLTRETYIKSKRGIKPKHLREITEDLIARRRLFLRKEAYYNRTIHRYYPTVIPVCSFTSRELEIIDFTIDELADNNAHTITQYAKRDPPILTADFGEDIDCRHVLSRNSRYSMKKLKSKNK